MKRNELILLCLLFLLAFGLRFYDVASPAIVYMDEAGHVPAATNYWNNGQFEMDRWEHPPLRHLIEYGFLQTFGANPYGWRMRNVLFGATTVVLIYLFALEVCRNRKAALMAGLLLATDPLHVLLSRHTFCEVYGTTFFLAAVLLYAKHNGRSRWLILSALLMGCALATKWNYVPGWILIYCLAMYEHGNYRNIRSAAFVSSTYLLLPLAIYILSFYQWFGRGYSLSEFADFVINIYYSFRQYTAESYESGLVFLGHLSALEWFVLPVNMGHGEYLADGTGQFRVYTNNLPVWIMTIPAMVGMTLMAVRERSMKLVLPVLVFCASYLLFIVVRRPAFIYSVTPLLPFAFTAIAYGIWRLADRFGRMIYYGALLSILSWNLYLYPLVTAKRITVTYYRSILTKVEMPPN
jgi:dolichyl-phosphate-mannose--protein O-mannosyl transferase